DGPAVAAPVHEGRADAHLGERVVDVGIVARRRPDDRRLARLRGCAPEAVDLPHVRAAEDAHQDALDGGLVIGQGVAAEEDPSAGPAAQDRALDGGFAHGTLLTAAGDQDDQYTAVSSL